MKRLQTFNANIKCSIGKSLAALNMCLRFFMLLLLMPTFKVCSLYIHSLKNVYTTCCVWTKSEGPKYTKLWAILTTKKFFVVVLFLFCFGFCFLFVYFLTPFEMFLWLKQWLFEGRTNQLLFLNLHFLFFILFTTLNVNVCSIIIPT